MNSEEFDAWAADAEAVCYEDAYGGTSFIWKDDDGKWRMSSNYWNWSWTPSHLIRRIESRRTAMIVKFKQ